MIRLLELATVALAAAASVFIALLAARRIYLARSSARRRSVEAELLPLVLGLLEGDEVELPALGQRESEILGALLGRFGRRLRGESAARATRTFEERGYVRREIAALRSLRTWRRATAAYALGGMGSRSAVDPLVQALRDRHRDVRTAAMRSLALMRAEEAVPAVAEALARGRVTRSAAGHALLELGEAALPELRRLAAYSVNVPRPGASETRRVAVELLGIAGGPADAVVAAERLADPAFAVRAAAARALSRLASEATLASLRAALADTHPDVRAAAAEALGMTRDTVSLPALLELARADEFEPAQAAARAAARIDFEAVRAAAPDSGHLQEVVDLAGVG